MRKNVSLFAVLILVLSVMTMLFPQAASAFDHGDLMSNSVYLNKNTMSQTQIQTFLESQGSTLATYQDQGPNETQQEPASYLIWHAAQIWGINPQVIITTLQKEQSLITNKNPSASSYQTAMGYGCPDGKNCSSLYYGFANQVNIATYQFRYNYEAVMGHSSFKDSDGVSHSVGSFACANGDSAHNPPFYNNGLLPGNVVTFSRNTAINGTADTTVTIADAATASFYCYTPHSGPYTSTGYSGSDNLVNFFNLWFGSTILSYNYSFEPLVAQSGAITQVNSSKLGDYTASLTSGRNIYTFYYDTTNKTLRLIQWDGNQWVDHLFDGAGATTTGATSDDVGTNVSEVQWNGQIQVFYYDVSAHVLRHAWLNNGQWVIENLDGTSSAVSKTSGDFGRNVQAVVWNNQLQLFYYDATNHALRHAWWANGQWNFEAFDGTANAVSRYVSNVGDGTSMSAIVWNGQIQLYYYDATNHALRHAWWANGQWNFEAFDGTALSVGKSTDDSGRAVSATIYQNQLELFYYDATSGSLKHAWWPGDGHWYFELLDGEASQTGTSTVLGNYINAGEQIATNVVNDNIFVFYYDDATGFQGHTSSWRIAYWKGGTWNQAILDGASTLSESGSSAAVGGQLSATTYNNSIQAFYQNSSGGLNHLWFLY